jgi:arylsulfatase A-like enzyme
MVTALLLFVTGGEEGSARSLPTGAEAGDRTAPNVVIVLADTLRPDYLPAYGAAESQRAAPFLTRLARRSTLFVNAFSTSSWTAPACASLFTGRYPEEHGVILGLRASRRQLGRRPESGPAHLRVNRLPLGIPLLPELFRERGYLTVGLSTNINIGPELGFQRGFDQFQRLPFDRPHPSRNVPTTAPGKGHAYATAEELASRARELLGSRSREPYLAYLHFNDAHAPYHLRAPWFRESQDELERARNAYRSEIAYLDRSLETLFQDLGWLEDTLVVFLSDHGEAFGEHGRRGHREGLYSELNRIALLIHDPRAPAAGRLNEAPTSIIDLLPTLIERCRLRDPGDLPGTSLSARLAGRPPRPTDRRRVLFASRYDSLQNRSRAHAVMASEWKLLVEQQAMLFHLPSDPGELNDLASTQPARVAELTALWKHFRATHQRQTREQATDLPLDQQQLEALEALGYVE